MKLARIQQNSWLKLKMREDQLKDGKRAEGPMCKFLSYHNKKKCLK